jgi:signal transduction histidine kinase
MSLTTLRRREAAALVLATVTALAGLTAWLLGEVDLGVRLGAAPQAELEGFVQISEVVPGSLAEYYGFAPGGLVVDMQRRDGSSAAQADSPYPNDQGMLDQVGDRMRFVSEWVPESAIDSLYAVGLDFETDPPWVTWGATLSRSALTSRLEGGGVLLLIGIALGGAAAAAVSNGWMGAARQAEALVSGAAVAVPLMALPLLYTGSPVGIVAGASLSALGVLPLAWSLAEFQAGSAWVKAVRWLALGLASLAVLLVLRRFLPLDSGLGGQQQAALLAAAAVMVPAVAAGLSAEHATRDRIQLLAMGVVPATAALVPVGVFPEFGPLAASLAAIVAWRAIPAGLAARLSLGRAAEDSMPAATPEEPVPEYDGPAVRTSRDMAALLVAATTFAGALLTCCESASVVFAALFGALIVFALHRGLMGPGWRSAAIPLGAAIAVPLMALTFNAGGGTQYLVRLLLPAAAALPVAHLLAWRHPDPAWRRLLFGGSLALASVVAVLALGSSVGGPLPGGPYDIVDPGSRFTIYLALGFIALVPALGGALARPADGAAAATSRLDLLAIGLTPGAAMTVLPGYSPAFWLLGLWLLALVAWRRFTIAPLLGIAQRTQRQRDLAVAAVEAERARLAADLHDDALQELSALVRRLDAAGDAESADLARGVAERLRAITSDLRLPLLDDLGAGPALEWLVGRVRPLAGGEVVLERADGERPPANVELAFFRVAQEALANAVKHGASPIRVQYRVAEDGGVSLSVDDAGPGIEPGAADRALQAGHLGMANMQQRAQQIGALLDVRRWPTGGTHVRLEWRPQ